MMNLEIHQKGQSDYLDAIKQKFSEKIRAIKNSELLNSKNIKVKIKVIKRTLLREKNASDYNNY